MWRYLEIYFIFSKYLFPKSCRFWLNLEIFVGTRQKKDENIKWHMRFLCWIPKATDAHTEYAIIVSIPQQQCWRQHSSVSSFCVHCSVVTQFYQNDRIRGNGIVSKQLAFIIVGGFVVQLKISISKQTGLCCLELSYSKMRGLALSYLTVLFSAAIFCHSS